MQNNEAETRCGACKHCGCRHLHCECCPTFLEPEGRCRCCVESEDGKTCKYFEAVEENE